MTDICGMKVDIRGDLEILGGKALVLNDVKVGEEMYVNHIFLRAQLEPLLAVLKSWRDTPVGSEAPPIFVQSITVRGVKCKAVDVHGIMRAYSIFRDAPGSISIGRLSLANVQAEMSYHDEDLGEPVESEVLYGVDGKEQMGGARSVFIRRMEFKGFASRMSLADMSASIATYCEKGGANAGKAMELEDLPPIALLREPSPGGDGDFRETYQTPPVPESKTDAMKKKLKDRGLNLLNQVKSGKGLDILPERARVWVPPAVSDQINNQLQTTVQNLAPVVQGRVAEAPVTPHKTLKIISRGAPPPAGLGGGERQLPGRRGESRGRCGGHLARRRGHGGHDRHGTRAGAARSGPAAVVSIS